MCAKGGTQTTHLTVQVDAGPVPAAPVLNSLSAVPLSGLAKITAAWSNVANETGYVVERATDPGFGDAVDANANANVVSQGQTGLGLNQTYYYRVKAKNLSGESGWSNVISVKTSPPDKPVLLSCALGAIGSSTAQVTATWLDVDGEKTYSLQRVKVPNPPPAPNFTSGVNTITGIAADTTSRTLAVSRPASYWFRVGAKNAFGTTWSDPLFLVIN